MVDIYLDGANLDAMRGGRKNPLVKGFTTNPSLARAAGVTNYETFCKRALEIADSLPISFEVLSDDFIEMERQARKIASWGDNIYVKIPVTNTKGESANPLVYKLSHDGIKCNVTAVFTYEQVNSVMSLFKVPSIISIFAGRIMDTGRGVYNGNQIICDAARSAENRIGAKILWASPREVFNIYQANDCGCHIITVTPDLLKKYEQLKGKDLMEYSLDTVKMFYNDAQKAGYRL